MKASNSNSILRLFLLALLLNPEFSFALGGPRGVRKHADAALATRHLSESTDATASANTPSADKSPSADEPSADASPSADEESSDDGGSVKSPSKRECETEQEDDEVEFECKAETEEGGSEIKDEIKFKVQSKGSDSLKVKVEYEQEIEDEATDTETETETKFEIVFDRVIEYRKVDETTVSSADPSSMSFDWETDAIVQTWAMTEWQSFTPVEEVDGLSTFFISTVDDIATFKFTIARGDVGDITTNKMKIDFDLNGFPWAANDTYVALICSVETERTIEVETEDDTDLQTSRKANDVKISFKDAVDTVGFTPFGEYSWAETAEATPANTTNTTGTVVPETITVVATSRAEGTSNEIAFSFVGAAAQSASDIYWDPEAGVGYAAGTGSGSSSATTTSLLLAGVTAFAFNSMMLLVSL